MEYKKEIVTKASFEEEDIKTLILNEVAKIGYNISDIEITKKTKNIKVYAGSGLGGDYFEDEEVFDGYNVTIRENG